MRKSLRAAVAVILTVITAFSLLVTASAAHITDDIPIVYVIGKVDVIYKNKDGSANNKFNKTLYPVSIDSVDFMDHLEEIMPAYIEAFQKEYELIYPKPTEQDKLKAWEKYALSLYGIVGDLYSELALDENGEPRDNSGIIWDWDKNYRDYRNGTINEEEYRENLSRIITDTVSPYGTYGLYDYTFHYDWRLDMYHNAEFLNEYINNVLEATGKEKCILISRCYGCNLVAAYMDKYGSEKIDKNIIYCSTASGTVVCSEMFSGNFELDPDGMSAYMDDLFFGEGSGIFNSFITASVKSSDFMEFSTLSGIVNKIYSRISGVMMPKTLINSFASMPGYWSLVNDDYYNEAKDFVFGSTPQEKAKYENFINKIDYYHYTVTNEALNIFKDACDKGMKYANIVKYGTQLAPMVKSSDMLGDGIVEVPSASFGGTAVKRGEKFSNAYMREAENNGTLRYISPDCTIDASTCFKRDCTWFAENVDHFDFPKSVDKLLLAIARFDGEMTIDDDSRFPQYKAYEGEGNLVTWAGGLYIENSRDETAGLLKKLLGIFEMIFNIFKAIFVLPVFSAN